MGFKAGLVSALIFLVFVSVWYLATTSSAGIAQPSAAGMTAEQIEYQKMLGKDPGNTGAVKA